LDVVIAAFFLVMAATAFFSTLPVIKRSQVMAQQESAAVLVANRMLEHLQMLKPADLTTANFQQLNLVDGPPDDAGYYSFTHVPLDEASGYSPAQMLRGGTGKFRILLLANGSKKIEMQVGWSWPTGHQNTLTTGTILGGYR